MYHVHKYVPIVNISEEEEVTTDQADGAEIPCSLIQQVLFGGDQLTAARARGAQGAKVNSFIPSLRLDGIIPCAEDWHTKMNFLGVCQHTYHASVIHVNMHFICRLCGSTSTPGSQPETMVPCISCATSFIALTFVRIPRRILMRVMIFLQPWLPAT